MSGRAGRSDRGSPIVSLRRPPDYLLASCDRNDRCSLSLSTGAGPANLGDFVDHTTREPHVLESREKVCNKEKDFVSGMAFFIFPPTP